MIPEVLIEVDPLKVPLVMDPPRILPGVVIVASLASEIAAKMEISLSVMVPSTISLPDTSLLNAREPNEVIEALEAKPSSTYCFVEASFVLSGAARFVIRFAPPIFKEPSKVSPALFKGMKPKASCLALKIKKSEAASTPEATLDATPMLKSPDPEP